MKGFDYIEEKAQDRYRFILLNSCIFILLTGGCVSKTQFDLCRDENNQLSQQIEVLNQTIKKQEAVISLQKTIVRLFDDPNHTLQANIKEQIASQNLESSAISHPTKFILANKLLFQPGIALLSHGGKQQLNKLQGILKEKRYAHVRVLGHTDDRPLKSTAKYANNWELSAARAMAVVQYLHEVLGVEPERMSVEGFGQYRPVASNDSVEGQRQNRRIEIILETTQ